MRLMRHCIITCQASNNTMLIKIVKEMIISIINKLKY